MANDGVTSGLAAPAPQTMDHFLKRLWDENPVFVQLLGMCPVLAVSNSVINAMAMGVATLFVLMMSSLLVSLLRNFIPKQVRIATFIMIIATFVTVADYMIQAISLEVHRNLGAFISLIVVNCIILGRAEAFASKNPVGLSFLDGIGSGLGFGLVLILVGSTRELLGSGSLLGYPILPLVTEQGWYYPIGLMLLAPSAFFIIGLLIWALRSWQTEQMESPSYQIRQVHRTEVR